MQNKLVYFIFIAEAPPIFVIIETKIVQVERSTKKTSFFIHGRLLPSINFIK